RRHELKKLFQRPGSVSFDSLPRPFQFGERPAAPLDLKERIVAESPLPARRSRNRPANFAVSGNEGFAAQSAVQKTDEASRAIRFALELSQQLGAIVGSICVGSAEAGGIESRRAIQGRHLQAGVISQ